MNPLPLDPSAHRRPRCAGLARAALVVALAASSCDPARSEASGSNARRESEATGRSWPAGTVLAVEDLPISADEVDRDSVVVQQIELQAGERALRRKALMRLTLPRAIGRVLAPEKRAEVLQAAERRRAELAAGEFVGPVVATERTGGFGDHDLAVWGAALETPIGEWTPLVDVGGEFVCAHVLERSDHATSAGVQFRLEVVRFPYVEGDLPQAVVEAAQDRLKLTIVDDSWRKIVPELTQYRMGVHGP